MSDGRYSIKSIGNSIIDSEFLEVFRKSGQEGCLCLSVAGDDWNMTLSLNLDNADKAQLTRRVSEKEVEKYEVDVDLSFISGEVFFRPRRFENHAVPEVLEFIHPINNELKCKIELFNDEELLPCG